MANGSSNTAVVAIVAVLILAFLFFFYFFMGKGPDRVEKTTIIEKERLTPVPTPVSPIKTNGSRDRK